MCCHLPEPQQLQQMSQKPFAFAWVSELSRTRCIPLRMLLMPVIPPITSL